MAAFDLLHPSLQHHIVNSMGWRELRPFQEEVIPAVLAGQHTLVIAPTAGGKTEAAILPILSRMLTEDWRGLSVLYLCPIRALLNNLHIRLSRYAGLVGRSCSVWHGDTSATQRTRINREQPDILLTTPESLELMLVSSKTDALGLFGQVNVVIVDELHAFAGDDRGWHLLSVLERVSRLAGREVQRIGLSATVGNPDALLQWLVAGGTNPGCVIRPPAAAPCDAVVQLDYVGSIKNAAIVISRLHRGEKRLVFVDSRARTEELGSELRQLEVKTFVAHSSLSKEQRSQAETAFASETDCVIVATSALELGIDVGDLDKVIQIDVPATVSSFLQRMGRTGRRSATKRNCLFLATRPETLLRAAALIRLWASGYVEPVVPPPTPFHILAQQIMALALQEGGIGRETWRDWIGRVPAFASMVGEDVEAILSHMLREDILWDDNGLLWFGKKGESTFGFRHFMELLSVFTSPPLFTVKHGQAEIGYVDQLSFVKTGEDQLVLSLGGHSWKVMYVDWTRRTAQVQPAPELPGRSRWVGSGQGLSFALCQASEQVLVDQNNDARWSRRACEQMRALRDEFAWLESDRTAIVTDPEGDHQWWTFAGLGANAAIASHLQSALMAPLEWDDTSISLPAEVTAEQLVGCIRLAVDRPPTSWQVPVGEDAIRNLKFAECLPDELAYRVLQERLSDESAVHAILQRPVKQVVGTA